MILMVTIPNRLSYIAPNVTISLGEAIGYADSAFLPHTLIEVADHALYHAKQDAQNCYKVANTLH